MLRALLKYPDLNGIFAHNDAMLLGAVDAYHETGKIPPPVLIGFDADQEARQAHTKRNYLRLHRPTAGQDGEAGHRDSREIFQGRANSG